jgi:DNA mismatch repair protein MutS
MAVLPPGVHEDYPADRESLTPLFRQYLAIKDGQPEGILFYRLGDFYEMFGPDAVRASSILGLTLTARNACKDYRVAMAGVPCHAAVKFIKRLVAAGEIVAICEQTEDPALAKGLVERAVTRVITAGTLVEDEYLSEDTANYLAVLLRHRQRFGLAVLDSATGNAELHEFDNDARSLRLATELVARLRPAELLLSDELLGERELTDALRGGSATGGSGPALQRCADLPGEADITYFLERQFNAASLQSFGLQGKPAAKAALYALLRYLRETYRSDELRISPRFVPPGHSLHLDVRTTEHLDLLGNSAGQGEPSTGGIYGLLNHCRTSAGRRELKRRLLTPYAEARQITASLDSIAYIHDNPELAREIEGRLSLIVDIERIVQRASLGRTNPRELRALTDSLPALDELALLLGNTADPLLRRLAELIGSFAELHAYMHGLLSEEPPVRLSDGNIVREGFDARVDELRSLLGGGEQWFRDYEEQERQRSGIRTLRVKFTNAFGYFIEVSKASQSLVPDDYTRRQTLVNAERYVTEELSRREAEVRGAQGKLEARERELYDELQNRLLGDADGLAQAARSSAALDVQLSLATTAKQLNWSRPELHEDPEAQRLEVEGGRHPLVEQLIGERYHTKNDCWLDSAEQQIMLITGPNMGGKSTYMRMLATLCVLGQCGSYVPASRALLPLLERIHTRVGAQDAQASGQSTFMVEMLETAEILNTAGPKSLVLLDEVGRGTSTYDGISIAKAVLEHLHEMPGRPLTLFATHFFELTDLELVLLRLKNFQVLVRHDGANFIFLYRVAPGAASDSFGIEVAALAGLPEGVVSRAREILGELEETRRESRERARKALQLGLF